MIVSIPNAHDVQQSIAAGAENAVLPWLVPGDGIEYNKACNLHHRLRS